ncbi:MAG: hypothetical protein WBE48_25105 [Xanthobacteraceae bacterium]
MATNLISLVIQYLTPEMIGRIATAVDSATSGRRSYVRPIQIVA